MDALRHTGQAPGRGRGLWVRMRGAGSTQTEGETPESGYGKAPFKGSGSQCDCTLGSLRSF